MRRIWAPVLTALGVAVAACGERPAEGPPVEFTIPSGASFSQVTDTLVSRGLVTGRRLFALRARMSGADREVRSGRYRVAEGIGDAELLEVLTRGQVVTVSVTIPEGFTLREMAPRLAEITGDDPADVLAALTDDSAHVRWGLPGPGLEGYLFPETYRFAEGSSLETVVGEMVEAYSAFWTEERRARLDSAGWSEHEIVTLASIVEAEATFDDEMPTIASVYRNRVDADWLLQADPTVWYALGYTGDRLLFAMIDSVADSPYNTYTQTGMPPGPIGAPGAAALAASLSPADTDFFYFVADARGRHVFTRTLAEHNAAAAEYRRRMFDDTGAPPPEVP